MIRSIAASLMAFLLAVALPALAEQPSPLDKVEADLRKSYPAVAVMGSEELAALKQTGADVVLLDARTDAEFGVSRIPGAQRVDPRMSAKQFQSMFGANVKDKKVVVYCAVGGRSSDLASRIDVAAKEAGAAGVFNLEGGIFRWHNEKRALEGPSGATDEVHPFSPNAAALIKRQEGVAYRPGTSKLSKGE
jgi:rhodanese-related sulfurtransferase